MIPLYTPAQVRTMDERTIASGTPSLVLMERAAGHLARAVVAAAGRQYGLRVLLLCGKGNNGGDGIAAALRLLRWGADTRVHLVGGEDDLSADSRAQLARYRAVGGRLAATPSWDDADAVVDCLLGTGSSGALREPYASVAAALNGDDRRRLVVACDLPSGVNADTGQVEGTAVRADVTVSLGAHKRGLWLWPARDYCGDLRVADIGIAPSGTGSGDLAPAALALERGDVAQAVGPADAALDKRGRGVVMVVAGSRGMSGAAVMVARGVLATGVGLLTVATSEQARPVVASAVPEAITVGLPDGDAAAAFDELAPRLDDVDVLAVGPGLGHAEETVSLVRRLVREADVDIVLDADGLNAFRGDGDHLAERRPGRRLVCTPHAREFARLLGKDVDDVWSDRVHTAAEASRRWRAEVVAKGPGTIVQSPEGATWINSTGTAALATGGTGDVLTGMIASVLAARDRPHGTAAAVWLHGLAGQIATRRGAERSVAAMDVAAAIPAALAALEHA